MILFKIAVSIFALLLIGFGLVLTISPIPFGIILVVIGFLLFVAAAPEQVRRLRKSWRWFDRAMHRVEKRMPKWIARRLRETDYDHDYEREERERKEESARA
ncbi:MAG: hypothetical protein KDD85_05700 [Parvularculaceae bacterium]|nr:hypothetical protein [Parvularculaceae bacterium]